MKLTTLNFMLFVLLAGIIHGAVLDDSGPWESSSLPDLYYEVMVASIPEAARFQADDGRFRSRIPADNQEDIRRFNMYIMQYIFVPALLYSSDNEANTLKGDPQVLKMALAAGDYLAGIVDAEGYFKPTVGGVEVSNLDSHRSLYCWAETYGLLKDKLGGDREKIWREAILRSGQHLHDNLIERVDRPRYTAPFLGTSPNHFGLWATTVHRIATLTGNQEWIDLANKALKRFVREVSPGGYWAEHDGPTMNYDYLNTAIAAYYWHYSHDPQALEAIRKNTEFHLHWCTPDGIDIATVDERNRNYYEVEAGWGLFSFCHFAEGRRFARFKLLSALDGSRDPVQAIGLSNLGRIAQDAFYHTDGPEAEIPQEQDSWSYSLDRPALVRKQGPWTWSYSAIVSVPSPYNQFFLDRICPISLWHEKTGHIISGGNSKNQPQLATFAVKRRDGAWDYMPLDALMEGGGESDTMCLAIDGYSLRLNISAQGNSSAAISIRADKTYNVKDILFLNLPLKLIPGREITTGGGNSYKLERDTVSLSGQEIDGSLKYGDWRIELPGEARFTWPYYTYSPYGPVRVPEYLPLAVGLISIPIEPDSRWQSFPIEILN